MARQPGFLKRGEPVRLQAFLARSGISSRRGAEEMITHGRIAVNGKTVTAMGMTVVPGVDRVAVDGEEVKVAPTTWLALHKPTGYVTTRSDPFDRRTVYDLLPEKYHGLFHVGRLDRDSEGLLLLTNDGELANRFLHPSFGITKEYDVVAKGKPTDAALRKLVEGVELEDGMAQAESAKLLGPAGNGLSRLKLVLREGKKREVRRMLAALGHEVTRLVRRRFGPIELGELPKGKYRVVQPDELSHVRTPSTRARAADTHGAYENVSNKPRSKALAGRAKTEAPRLRETVPVAERRPRFKAPGDEPRTRTKSAGDEPRTRTKTVGAESRTRTKPPADDLRTRARTSGEEPRTSARTGERTGTRVGGDATPKRAGGARGGAKLRSGARFDAPEIGKKRRTGQEQRGRPADPNPRPPGPRKEARSLNEWDDAAPPPRTADRTSRGRPDREYEDRPAARAGSARGDRAERGGRAGGTRGGAERGGRAGGARGGFDRDDRAGGSRGAAGERGGRAGGARGGFEREDRAPARGGTGERGSRAGGARGGFEREDRAGGSRGGAGERGGRTGGARGGFEREDRAPARGGTGERGSRAGGARGGFDREDRAPARGGTGERGGRGGGARGGFEREDRAGGSRGGAGERGGRGGGARGGFHREDRAPARGGAGARGGGARGAGGERGSRSGGTRGGSFERDDRPGPPRGRFSGEERDGGARGARPGATRGPSPADDDRDELDDWGTAPRRPRTGGAGGPRGAGGARGGRPGAGRGGGARGGGSRVGGSRGGARPDADGGSDAPRGGGARGGGGRPGAGGRGGGGRPGGRPGGARGGGARGGRPGDGRRG